MWCTKLQYDVKHPALYLSIPLVFPTGQGLRFSFYVNITYQKCSLSQMIGWVCFSATAAVSGSSPVNLMPPFTVLSWLQIYDRACLFTCRNAMVPLYTFREEVSCHVIFCRRMQMFGYFNYRLTSEFHIQDICVHKTCKRKPQSCLAPECLQVCPRQQTSCYLANISHNVS